MAELFKADAEIPYGSSPEYEFTKVYYTDGGSTFQPTVGSKYNGDYGYSLDYTTGAGKYNALEKDLAASYSGIKVGSWIKVSTPFHNQINPDFTRVATFLWLGTIAGVEKQSFGISFYKTGEASPGYPKGWVWYTQDVNYHFTDNYSLNTWHYIEMLWQAGNPGVDKLWIDTDLIYDLTGGDRTAETADRLDCGQRSGACQPDAGEWIHFDDVTMTEEPLAGGVLKGKQAATRSLLLHSF